MSIGYLPGSHRPDCPVMKRLSKAKPPFLLQAKRRTA